MGFNLDQKGLQSFMGSGTKGGPEPKQKGPDAETSKREALRLAATLAQLR